MHKNVKYKLVLLREVDLLAGRRALGAVLLRYQRRQLVVHLQHRRVHQELLV